MPATKLLNNKLSYVAANSTTNECNLVNGHKIPGVTNVSKSRVWKPRFSSTVCLAVFLSMVFALRRRTDSESEQEDDIINVAHQLCKQSRCT